MSDPRVDRRTDDAKKRLTDCFSKEIGATLSAMCHGSTLARERRHYGFERSDGMYSTRVRGTVTVTVTVATAAPVRATTGRHPTGDRRGWMRYLHLP